MKGRLHVSIRKIHRKCSLLYDDFAKSCTRGMESLTRFMQTKADQQQLNQVLLGCKDTVY